MRESFWPDSGPCPLFSACVLHAAGGGGAGSSQSPVMPRCPHVQRVHNRLQELRGHRCDLIRRELHDGGSVVHECCLRQTPSPLGEAMAQHLAWVETSCGKSVRLPPCHCQGNLSISCSTQLSWETHILCRHPLLL